jgi:hypothetical protein
MEMVVAAGFALGLSIIAWALTRIIMIAARTAVKRDEGIHAFVRSFDANQFQGRDERKGK